MTEMFCWYHFWSSDVATSGTSLHLCLGLQNKKGPSGVGRRSLRRRSSQSSVYMKRRERERENDRSPKWFLYSLLYPCMLYVHFALVKHKAQWGRLISSLTWFDWSHKYRRLPATKVHVRGLISSGVRNPTCGANLAPPQSGDKYFPNMFEWWYLNS
jgi:hypothetical protein